mmetsp:Transcript_31084/g.77877  ORF Transcript_31084/g.77877 Transcript_31084/m.77877 type:complete len:208 (-) Transcript_31084:423-1046(-)
MSAEWIMVMSICRKSASSSGGTTARAMSSVSLSMCKSVFAASITVGDGDAAAAMACNALNNAARVTFRGGEAAALAPAPLPTSRNSYGTCESERSLRAAPTAASSTAMEASGGVSMPRGVLVIAESHSGSALAWTSVASTSRQSPIPLALALSAQAMPSGVLVPVALRPPAASPLALAAASVSLRGNASSLSRSGSEAVKEPSTGSA